MTQSVSDLCSKISIFADLGGVEPRPDFPNSHPWKVTMKYNGRQLTTPFYTGRSTDPTPTVQDVLYCLIQDALSVETATGFEDWASDAGYDTDSRKAERLYKACCKEQKQLRRFLGTDFNTFAEAFQDY